MQGTVYAVEGFRGRLELGRVEYFAMPNDRARGGGFARAPSTGREHGGGRLGHDLDWLASGG
jgi:hypothetical protein